MNQVDDEKSKCRTQIKTFMKLPSKIKGLVTPLIIEWTYEDGSIEIENFLQKYGG